MGWKSTLKITREDAIREILARVTTASNTQLSSMLDAFSEDPSFPNPLYGHNFTIVEYYDEPDSDYDALGYYNLKRR